MSPPSKSSVPAFPVRWIANEGVQANWCQHGDKYNSSNNRKVDENGKQSICLGERVMGGGDTRQFL